MQTKGAGVLQTTKSNKMRKAGATSALTPRGPMDKELRVTWEPTASLVPYANNAKRHTREQVDQICNSIREFGFNDPIGVWTNEDGKSEIIEGHGRVIAAQRLGMESVPIIHLDSLTDAQRRAYTLAHNQLTMNTGFDFDTLSYELDTLAESFDMTGFGFPEHAADIDELFTEQGAEDGETPEPHRNTVTCPHCGEVFEP